MMRKLFRAVLFAWTAGWLARGEAQQVPALENIKSDAELTRAVTALDTALFDAYNRCAIETLGAMVVDDLEFYHDKTGLAVGKQIFLESIKKNICGKVTRELVAGSLEVYPMHGYGAVEIGTHRFHHPGEQDHDVLGEAKFVMLWQYKDGAWKITRVISYDHATVK
jgi:hypothetical protein